MNTKLALELQSRGFNYTHDYESFKLPTCDLPEEGEIEECKKAILNAIERHGSLEKAVLWQNYDVLIEEYQGEVSHLTLSTFLACRALNLPMWYKPITFGTREAYGTSLDLLSIYETTNYSIFEIPSKENRISLVKLNRLKRLVETENLLPDRCIVVEDKAPYYVLDGVHRLLAAKELRLPIYFRCSQSTTQVGVERVRRLEALNKILEAHECVMP